MIRQFRIIHLNLLQNVCSAAHPQLRVLRGLLDLGWGSPAMDGTQGKSRESQGDRKGRGPLPTLRVSVCIVSVTLLSLKIICRVGRCTILCTSFCTYAAFHLYAIWWHLDCYSFSVNPLKGSGIRWLYFKVFSAIEV